MVVLHYREHQGGSRDDSSTPGDSDSENSALFSLAFEPTDNNQHFLTVYNPHQVLGY